MGSGAGEPKVNSDRVMQKRALARVRDDFRIEFVPRKRVWEAMTHLEDGVEAWCETISEEVEAGNYSPAPPVPISVPKKNFHVRPGKVLVPQDVYAYNYAVWRMLPRVVGINDWSATTVRFSYRANVQGKEWFRWRYSGWRNFDKVSLGKLKGRGYVVIADIAGYYENIDVGRLMREVGVYLEKGASLKGVSKSLSSCLNKWGMPRGRGIPQAMAPSHVLAELYLNPLDVLLRSRGFEHVRYLDDIRIFCDTKRDAISALHALRKALDVRGLNLQSAKSKIVKVDDARDEWRRVRAIVKRISDEILREITNVPLVSEYVEPEEVVRRMSRKSHLAGEPDLSAPDPEVIERAWEGFESGELIEVFDKTIYHYLLGRLADVGSSAAVSFSLAQLEDRPEETSSVLKYLDKVLDSADVSEVSRGIGKAIGESVYDHQVYQLFEWMSQQKMLDDVALKKARRLVDGGMGNSVVLEAAVEYLAAASGEVHDFNIIEGSLSESSDEMSRIAHILALRNVSGSLARGPLGRFSGEGQLVEAAIRYVKSGGG